MMWIYWMMLNFSRNYYNDRSNVIIFKFLKFLYFKMPCSLSPLILFIYVGLYNTVVWGLAQTSSEHQLVKGSFLSWKMYCIYACPTFLHFTIRVGAGWFIFTAFTIMSVSYRQTWGFQCQGCFTVTSTTLYVCSTLMKEGQMGKVLNSREIKHTQAQATPFLGLNICQDWLNVILQILTFEFCLLL